MRSMSKDLRESRFLGGGITVVLVGAAYALYRAHMLQQSFEPALIALVGSLAGILSIVVGLPEMRFPAISLEGVKRRERIVRPAHLSAEQIAFYEQLDRIADHALELQRELEEAQEDNDALKVELAELRAHSTISPELLRMLETAMAGTSEGLKHFSDVQQVSTSFHDWVAQTFAKLTQSVDVLASNAEESSSAILEMAATNEEVVENTGNLANSVRETVSSMEEMTYSIKEVARNVDALSLTAEETSSSMNQIDVSIDQVQSNANETAKLSEQVARDAEIGAEAILKTILEINRIKETSREAVDVISTLGTRIEAIGDILDVIDEVAEQTNLLALNAAIIAAQAGEHGKGFAVVADEIKDLAERAGASTREIAELIKSIQAESKRGIAAVERGATTVDRGVEVSADAESALKKILESSKKSTGMVRAIARATVEQAKGSKQVTDAIGRIAETVQQIAAATAEQARGSELVMKSAERMHIYAQHVERSADEQAKGSRQVSQAIENIASMVTQLNESQKQHQKEIQTGSTVAGSLVEASRALNSVRSEVERSLQIAKR